MKGRFRLSVLCTVTTDSAQKTFAFGQALAAFLRPGGIVALTGPLGAGKTTLAQGILSGLGLERPAASPTFTIINRYRLPHGVCYHIDAYRLDGIGAFFDIGGDEAVSGQAPAVVEWADRIRDALPADALWIDIQYVPGRPEARQLVASGPAERWGRIGELVLAAAGPCQAVAPC